MASRRKSAKPTNKLRHVPVDNNNDNDEDDSGDDLMEVAFASLSTHFENNFNQATKTSIMPTLQVGCHPTVQPNQYHHPIQNTLLLAQHNDDQGVSSSQAIEEPLLALPSDVYNDFEALRSATKLDSPALMRRLLKYYSKLTSSTVDRERKLDNVIEGIRERSSSTTKEQTSCNSSNDLNGEGGNTNSRNNSNNNNIINGAVVLDLSLHRKDVDKPPPSYSSNDVVVDEMDDSENSPRPLDLTLQKEDQESVLPEVNESVECSNVQHGTASSLFSTCFQAPAESSPCVYSSTDMNQAAPYVINLEPLTSTIQLSTPGQYANNTKQRNGIHLPDAYDSNMLVTVGERLKKEATSFPINSQKSLVSNILTGSKNIQPSLIPISTQVPKSDPKPSSYPPSALFPMHNTPLPTYKEAVNSSLFSNNKTSYINKATCSTNSSPNMNESKNKDLFLKKTNIDFANHLINSDGRHISVLQLNPDFHNIKNVQSLSSNTPENFLLEPTSQKHPQSQEFISAPNFLLTDSMPSLTTTLSPSSSSVRLKTHQESSQFEERVGLPILNSVEQRIQMSCATTSNTRTQLPPSVVSSNTMHTLLSTTPQSSQDVYTQSAMPLQSLLMSQASDGSVSNVVAIPVLQGLPEGYTTLQHFTFEPAVPLPAKSEMQKAPLTTAALPLQPIIVSAPISSSTDSNTFLPVTNHVTSATTLPSNVNASQNYPVQNKTGKEWVKLKPGRPKGKTGKVNSSRKVQNKGMKLLTENSLFPGVYTSILKLPWSKRTRNKSKAKPEDSVKSNCEGQFEENSTDNFDVQSEERSQSYIPPELVVNVKESMIDNVQEPMKGIRNENIMLQAHRQQTSLDQQQHQLQYANQYHINLNEEHQKTHELDPSICPDQNPCSPSLATSQGIVAFTETHSSMNVKREICEPSEICSEIRHNVMLSSASISAGQEQSNISNSQDPIMLIYPNIGPNGSKSRKRRGRPPKKPMVEPKVHQDSFLFPVESMFQASDSISDASFLHGNNSNLTFIPSVSTPLTQEFTLMSPTTLPSSLPSNERTDTIKATSSSSDFPSGLRENDETTLENRIIFLTSQIEMEMARGANQQPSEQYNANTAVNKQIEQSVIPQRPCVESSTAPDKSEEKPVEGVKRRRKKTSRMLKSNENFVYATFRFKPRGGSGAKKSKKKRKPSTTSLAVNAETIANLRNKKLKCLDAAGPKSDSETVRNDFSVQSWKFHEQYPSEARQEKSPVPNLSIISCSSCGVPVRKINDVPNDLQVCLSCSKIGVDGNKKDHTGNSPHYDNDVYDCPMGEKDEESLSNSCISCGKRFEGFLDSDSQCEICRRSAQSFIGSSKLFSISDTTHHNPGSFPNTDLISNDGERLPAFDPNTPITTDGNLYCSLCRMQFTKISQYLFHLKETHEATKSCKTEPLSQKPDDIMENSKTLIDSVPRRIKSTLKTKKSLAHKTITCPIEDCPLFFRHQREMDHHLKKVHRSSSLLAPREAGPAAPHKDISIVQNQVPNINVVNKNVCTSLEDPHSSVFNQQFNNKPVTVTLEESGDNRVTSDHTQEKPLRCSFCNFRCRQKNAMTWHMRKHPEAASQHRCYSNTSSE